MSGRGVYPYHGSASTASTQAALAAAKQAAQAQAQAAREAAARAAEEKAEAERQRREDEEGFDDAVRVFEAGKGMELSLG